MRRPPLRNAGAAVRMMPRRDRGPRESACPARGNISRLPPEEARGGFPAAGRSLRPGCLECRQAQRCREVQSVNFLLPISGKPFRQIKNQQGIQPSVFTGRCPGQRTERQAGLVRMESSHKIPGLGSSRESQQFMGGRVQEVQPAAQHILRLDGKEPKGGVVHPLQFHGVLSPAHRRPVERWLAQLPAHLTSRCLQSPGIGDRTLRHCLRDIVADINVPRVSGSLTRGIQERGPKHKTVRTAMMLEEREDFTLERSYRHNWAAI